jgi:thiamine biosynthesis lipoprotein
MACEFSLLFPGQCRAAVPAGCAALDEIERLEAKLSVYRTESVISSLNRGAYEAPVPVDAEVFELLLTAERIHRATRGAFDVATGALTKAWGFYRGPRRVPGVAELQAARDRSGLRHVELDPQRRTVRFHRPGLELNLGAIGKGFALDRALARIHARCALLEAGQSSLRAAGAPPEEPRGWRVAIGDPGAPQRTIAVVWLKDRALGTSAATHQWFAHNGNRYGHILDPRSGWPADRLASASALAPSAAEADAVSTAFFVLGLEAAQRYCREHPGIAAVLVTRSAEVVVAGDGDVEVET